MELHILLQSQHRHASQLSKVNSGRLDNGDSLSLVEALGGAAPRTAPAPRPTSRSPARPAALSVPTPVLSGKATPASVGPSRSTAPNAAAGAPAVNFSHGSPPAGSSSAGPTPRGYAQFPDRAFHARYEQDMYGNRIDTYTAETIDMETIDRMLTSTSHTVKGISGAIGNCWLRAGWLAAIGTHVSRSNGQELETLLKNKLGPDFYDDARKVGEMATACRRSGIQEIVTGMELANRNADFESASCLKMPGVNNDIQGHEGEAVCTRLTYALLRNAGMSEVDLDKYIAQSNFGEHCHINTLLRELECDSIVLGKQFEWSDASATARFRPDRSLLAISARPGSRLANIRVEAGQSCTDALLSELDTSFVLLHKGAHYELCYPKSSLDCRGHFQWPT